MQSKQMKLVVTATSALVALSCGAVQAAPTYTITDLGTLGGPNSTSKGLGINASGQVVGEHSYGYSGGTYFGAQAFIYSNGTMTDLGTFGGGTDPTQARATSINDSGLVTVVAQNLLPGNGYPAYIYDNGSKTSIGTLGGPDSYATAINASGQIVGRSTPPSTYYEHAFLYSDGAMTDLAPFAERSEAKGINASGQVVGWFTSPASLSRHAFLYSGGVMTDLGLFGGQDSSATAINASGQIVGSYKKYLDPTRAFLYSGGVMTDLGTLGGISIATGINASGKIIGYSQIEDLRTAWLYSDGSMVDLNSLIDPLSGWKITEAAGINDLGQIVANSCTTSTSGVCRALLLTPVPEAETYMMMLAGLGLLGVMARRRNNMRQ